MSGSNGTEDTSFTHYFIGGIQRNVTNEDIERYFSAYGEVSSFVLKKDTLGRSRGYGWLRFRNPTPNLPRGKHSVNGVSLIVDLAHTPQEREALAISKQRERVPSGHRSRSGSSYSSTSSQCSRSRSARRHHARHKTDSCPIVSGNNHNQSNHNGSPVPAGNHYQSAIPQGFVPPQSIPLSIVPQQQIAVPASDVFVCIPMPLCPPAFLQDPRVFCAKLDGSRLGSLQILQPLARPGAFPENSYPNGVVPRPQGPVGVATATHSFQTVPVTPPEPHPVMYVNRQFSSPAAATHILNPPPPGPPPCAN